MLSEQRKWLNMNTGRVAYADIIELDGAITAHLLVVHRRVAFFFFGRIADDVAFPDPAKNGLSVADRPNASQSRKWRQATVRATTYVYLERYIHRPCCNAPPLSSCLERLKGEIKSKTTHSFAHLI